jgi:hypothetical protein
MYPLLSEYKFGYDRIISDTFAPLIRYVRLAKGKINFQLVFARQK